MPVVVRGTGLQLGDYLGSALVSTEGGEGMVLTLSGCTLSERCR